MITQLPQTWESNCLKVIEKFYSDPFDQETCMSEVKQVIRRSGAWGHLTIPKQALIRPTDNQTFANIVERYVWQQERMKDSVADWDTTGKIQFPHLHPIALRLAVLSVQSADVERICKAHKVIQTKARNKLKNLSVQMLLFTYVNLRLLHERFTQLTEFLTQIIEALDEDQPDSINTDLLSDELMTIGE